MKRSVHTIGLVLLLLTSSVAQELDEALVHAMPVAGWTSLRFAGIEQDMKQLSDFSSQTAVPFQSFGRNYSFGVIVTTPIRNRVRLGFALHYFESQGDDNIVDTSSGNSGSIQSKKYAVACWLPQLVFEIPRLTAIGHLFLGMRLAGGPAVITFRRQIDAVVSAIPFPAPLPLSLWSEYKTVVPQVALDLSLRYPLSSFLSIQAHGGWITSGTKAAAPEHRINGVTSDYSSTTPSSGPIVLGMKGWSCGAGLELHF